MPPTEHYHGSRATGERKKSKQVRNWHKSLTILAPLKAAFGSKPVTKSSVIFTLASDRIDDTNLSMLAYGEVLRVAGVGEICVS